MDLVTIKPVEVDDSVPTEDEIEEVVKKLSRNRSGGLSGMRAEHLKGWLAASKRENRAAEKGEVKTEGEEEGGTTLGEPRGVDASACSSSARADHGGAGRPIKLRAIPGREHTGHSTTSKGGRLGTYGGRYRGGS